MKGSLFILECLTNLHVGSGSFNYDIVDNQVERDVITNYPTIYSSSLKGAMREHFRRERIAKSQIEAVFGGEYKITHKSEGRVPNESVAGKVKFFDCKLLALPVRSSKGRYPYYMVTTKEMLEEFCLWAQLMTEEVLNLCVEEKIYFIGNENVEEVGLEYLEEAGNVTKLEVSVLNGIFSHQESILKKGLFVLPQEKFNELSLPIRARNCLGNSKSINLWYEEHVPYKSLFYTSFMANGEKDSEEAHNTLTALLENNIVQVGGNASIGFGLIEFKKWGNSGDQ
ncbi:type III-B CRISPR module RAMP protein Cmr4 [Aerococcaceae bacterium NML190938]|nr:type III-B CRISPR module RAMP protein Cmr4 [Aerococcaceae bacterium NML190938]